MNTSICHPSDEAAPAPGAEELTRRARILLSAVARMQGEWGMTTVAAVLRGSTSKKLVEHDLDKLSVWGMLAEFRQAQLVGMLEALLEAGLIMQGSFQCVGLTAYGTAVMRGQRPLPAGLADALERALLCKSPPKDLSPDAATVQMTLEYLRAGLAPALIAERRNLKLDTIVTHIAALHAAGEPLDLSPHLDPELLAALRTLAPGWRPGDAVSPIYDAFDGTRTWGELKLHLVALMMEEQAIGVGRVAS